MTGTELTYYNAAKTALAQAARIDEVKDVKDKAEAIRLYAQQQRDNELERYANEIKARAMRRLGQLSKELEVSPQAKGGRLPTGGTPTKTQVLKDAGVSKSTAHRAEQIAAIPEQEFEEKISRASTVMEILKEKKEAERKENIERQREEIKRGVAKLPQGKFEIIAIDPPWPYEDGKINPAYDADGHRASNPYPEMSLEEISNIEIPFADDCVLWLWTTHKFMRNSFSLLDKWGFEEKAIVTWVKDRMGLGRWLRSQSEFCIMAVKGRPTINLTNQTTVLNGKMREHSRKPEEFYAMVDNLCVGRKLDYFSRQEREGWECFGNDTSKFQ